jgi:hypothetical protein
VPKYQTKAFTGQKPPVLPDRAMPETLVFDIEFPTVAPVGNDLIEIVTLPIGLQVLDWALVFPDLDSAGSAALVWSLGTADTAGTDLGLVWTAGITAGQSTAIVRNANSVPAQEATTAARTLALKCTTAAGTWAGADKVGQIILTARA